jgi:hypothetical protein
MTDTLIATEPAWFLDWRGRTWASTDLTGHHASAVAELVGVAPDWAVFDVTELHPVLGPLQTMALIAAFICVDDQVHGDTARRAVLEAVKDATVDELVAAIRLP